MRMITHIDENMGSMLIGVVVSAVLLGISFVQTFYYFMSYSKDPWYLRSLVALTAVLDTVHLAMISHTVYHYLVRNYNNPPVLDLLVWTVLIEALFTGLTGALVQCFYLTRVWRLSRNILLTGTILLIVLANAACGTAWVILSMQLDTYDQLLTISPITISINALSAAADILIALSLCVMLIRARTGFRKSDTLINRLIVFIVNTGLLTSLCATASLISLLASPLTLIYASFYFCLGRFYTNSLLATLNARKIISGRTEDDSHLMVSVPSTLLNAANKVHSTTKSSQNLAIRIDTTKEQHSNTSHGQTMRENKQDFMLARPPTSAAASSSDCVSLEFKSKFVV